MDWIVENEELSGVTVVGISPEMYYDEDERVVYESIKNGTAVAIQPKETGFAHMTDDEFDSVIITKDNNDQIKQELIDRYYDKVMANYSRFKNNGRW